jgi:hypothetical protein
MRVLDIVSTSLALYVGSSTEILAQWVPVGGLLDVPVIQNCTLTQGRVAVAKPDGVFLCKAKVAEVEAQTADASHFFIVHEYGHLAIRTTSGKLADCWAAHRLAEAPNGPHYVKQWIKHWRIYGTPDPSFGSREQRINDVRSCCACGA